MRRRNRRTAPPEAQRAPCSGMLRKGSWGCRIIKVAVVGGREWQLHATKGWRSRRATGSARRVKAA